LIREILTDFLFFIYSKAVNVHTPDINPQALSHSLFHSLTVKVRIRSMPRGIKNRRAICGGDKRTHGNIQRYFALFPESFPSVFFLSS